MPLPGAERAIVSLEKLRGYCLDAEHPEGRHKARVFRAALGLNADDAEWLQTVLLEIVRTREAVPVGLTSYGRLYVIDFPLSTPAGQAVVRCSWIIRSDERFPRLTSCYVRT